jgi:branched-subunit amino acid transport protein AzlD
MIPAGTALLWIFAIAAAVFLCRLLPFLIFSRKGTKDSEGRWTQGILDFVEKVAPPVCMTVLAFNALASPAKTASAFEDIVPLLAASVVTALLHLWKRNALVSIFGGTALYMLLTHLQ